MQKVVPAILTADPAELRDGLKALRDQVHWVHIDIMDGKFVPNTSINLFELGEAYQFFNLEIHLMVESPEKYLEDCKGVEAKRVVFHAEAAANPGVVLDQMEKYSFQKAIAINPSTLASNLSSYIDKLDAVLVMGVHPGLQGQEFLPQVLEKVPAIRQMKEDIVIGLDGGMNEATIQQAFEAGVDYVCAGSAVMKAPDPAGALRSLGEMIK